MELYFKDNFFNSGVTEIMDASGANAGMLDLKSAFSASLSVYGPDQQLLYTAKFPFFSRGWEISDADGRVVGVLRAKFSLFSKRYQYNTDHRGTYMIESPAFSKSYTILDDAESTAALFDRTSQWPQSGSFRLQNHSDRLDLYELVAVVMGVHSIQKAAASSAAST